MVRKSNRFKLLLAKEDSNNMINMILSNDDLGNGRKFKSNQKVMKWSRKTKDLSIRQEQISKSKTKVQSISSNSRIISNISRTSNDSDSYYKLMIVNEMLMNVNLDIIMIVKIFSNYS